jgi:hypothetical protein
LLPQVTDNDFTERDGVIKVAYVANRARCVWRETPMRDVGIDGQIEYVTPQGDATGRIVALQIKSGPSYVKENRDGDLTYSVPEKHASYWENFPLPVVLVLHDEESDLTVWTDGRAALRRRESPIRIGRDQIFDKEGLLRALSLDGPLPDASAIANAEAIVREMVANRFVDVGIDVNFLDLFSFGLTDLSTSLFFGMEVFMEAVAGKAEANEDPLGPGIGSSTFDFIDRYVGYLVARNLVRVDFDSWRQVKEQRQMVGRILGPLTAVGLETVGALTALNERLVDHEQGPVIEERIFDFVPLRISARGRALKAIADSIAG